MKTTILFLFIICTWAIASKSDLEVAKEPQPTCNCTYPLKNNTNWCPGKKSGHYCINKKGTKTYKKI